VFELERKCDDDKGPFAETAADVDRAAHFLHPVA
jgi:hypothetical protein